MTRVLFQGVDGISDASTLLRQEMKSGSFAHHTQAGLRLGPRSVGMTFEDEGSDPKLREECGVVAIHGHADAARQVYLGLYALQHRGQESAGIASADGQRLANIKGMGLVSEIFTDDVLSK